MVFLPIFNLMFFNKPLDNLFIVLIHKYKAGISPALYWVKNSSRIIFNFGLFYSSLEIRFSVPAPSRRASSGMTILLTLSSTILSVI